jgi:molybdopterin converting factor small subunit
MATLLLPFSLSVYAKNLNKLSIAGDTVKEVLLSASFEYADLSPYILNQDGELNSFVGYFLNDKDIRQLEGINTPISPADTLTIVTATAGG